MQECETGTGKSTLVKRVTVRSGGAGHAHSGVAKERAVRPRRAAKPSQPAENKIVELGR
jgi:hypothetical protein